MILRDEVGRAVKAPGHHDGDGCVFPSPGHMLTVEGMRCADCGASMELWQPPWEDLDPFWSCEWCSCSVAIPWAFNTEPTEQESS